jgi:DNA polymerase III subunit beta
MKFIIAKSELSQVLSKLQNVISAKATIPILSNVLIEATHNELVFTATDLTVGIRCFTEAKIIEEGATTIPLKRFLQLIRELTAVNIEITATQDDVAEIVADSSNFTLKGMPRNEFPALPDLTGASQFTVSQALLKDMLFRTAFAISREDSRYVLTGNLMHIHNSKATFVGTDGKRLAKNDAEINIDSSYSGQFIIPFKSVEEILKLLEDNEDAEATIYLMDDKVAIEANQSILITKLLAGDYPDFERVIPSETEMTLSLHREELVTLLRQISLFTAETNHSVRFTFSQGELMLTANDINIGEGKVSMPVNYSGNKLDVAFNPNFFLDILRHSKDESVQLSLTDAYNPGVITDSSAAVFILMPMRLNEQ